MLSGDFPMMEHKIEFEKLKEPEDQLAMESVGSNFDMLDKPAEKGRCKFVLQLCLSTCTAGRLIFRNLSVVHL